MKYWGLMVLTVLLTACPAGDGVEPSGRSPEAARPLVYTSNYPLQYFAERIASPVVEVRMRVPAGTDPAFWKPTAEDVEALGQADLVLLNGASYESWLKNVSLRESRLVDTSSGFQDRFIARKEATTHSHGPEGEHEHAATAFTTWLDLTLAVEQARAIEEAFSERWPEHAGRFRQQLEGLVKGLEALDAELIEAGQGVANVPVVFSHPVYQYLARRYDLDGRSVHWEPDEAPSDDMWHELTHLLGSHPAKWMIWEGEPSPETSSILVAQGIQSVVFDPCGAAPDDGDFASVMQQNLVALKSLSGQP